MPTLTALPATVQAGDSYAITLSLPDYPATGGWSVTYAIAGGSTALWSSTPSGDRHVLTLSSASTAALEAGLYQYTLKATKTGSVETVERGTVTVAADVSALAAGEGVSYWYALKCAAQDALTGIMAGGGVRMTMIMGRQMMFATPADCLKVISYCDQRLAAERRGNAFGRVQVAFTR